ncbi:MAG: hypothetical protein Q9181_007394 [Wetmoreana brouardii]
MDTKPFESVNAGEVPDRSLVRIEHAPIEPPPRTSVNRAIEINAPTVDVREQKLARSPFAHRYSPIGFVRMLSDPERQGMAQVFEVNIAAKTYALKILPAKFKYYDIDETDDAIYGSERDAAPDDALKHLDYYFDPFYIKCRAYGRLVDAKLSGKIAVHCHGYMMLPASYEDELKRDFGAGDWRRPNKEYRKPISRRQSLRAIVKDLILEDREWTPKDVRKRLGDLKKMRMKGVFPKDIKKENYVGGLLVDFSIAFTEPHFIFDVKPPHWVDIEKRQDLVNFDIMIDEELKLNTLSRSRVESGKKWPDKPGGRKTPQPNGVTPKAKPGVKDKEDANRVSQKFEQ